MAFGVNAQVSITGEAVGGWGDGHDFDMTTTDNVHWSYNGLICNNANSPTGTEGGIKFRFNHAWTTNWGAADFPTGTGLPGGTNIQCTAGNWDVSFNSDTGEYTFIAAAPLPVVKLTGPATSGTDISMSTLDGHIYTLTDVTLVTGNAQVMIDADIFGGDTFPIGVLSDPSLFIPVVAGTYSNVTVNVDTGDYTFEAAPVYPAISVVGSGVGGWPGDPGNPGPTDVNQLTTTDGVSYKLVGLTVTAGEAKFRKDNSWGTNWGGTTFPSGTGVLNGANIPTTAGLYDVSFNYTTLDYNFSFASVSIVGSAVGGWPGDPGNPGPIDANQLTTTDGINYTLSGFTTVDGEAKFRQNNDWTVNWGAGDFPSGVGVQAGPNIMVAGGTYDITFNKLTGVYNFAVLATTGFDKGNFKVYPNPTANSWNFNATQNIDTITIVDVLGKTIMSVSPKATTATIDASALNAGVYFAKIGTAAATQTIKVVKN